MNPQQNIMKSKTGDWLSCRGPDEIFMPKVIQLTADSTSKDASVKMKKKKKSANISWEKWKISYGYAKRWQYKAFSHRSTV